MEVRPAQPRELDTVLDVLAAAATWLRARGIEQWPERFPADWVMPPIERGETWLAEADSRVAGTLTVQWTDELSGGSRLPTPGISTGSR